MKQKLLQYYFSFFWFFAKKYLQKHKPIVIGVTGSIGKTSCRMLISTLIEQSFPEKKVFTSEKNFNGELWMSLSILWISQYTPSFLWVIQVMSQALFFWCFGGKKYDIIFLEYGIDHIGEMDFMLSIAKPEIGIVTKIDRVHAAQFTNIHITAAEKYKLLQHTFGQAYLNIDDTFSHKYMTQIQCKKRWFATSLASQEKNLDVVGKNFSFTQIGQNISSKMDLFLNQKHTAHLISNTLWSENIGYIAVWYDIVEYLSQKMYKKWFFLWEEPQDLKVTFTLQHSRFSFFEWKGESILLDSSYNAAPESMKRVLENAKHIQSFLYPEREMICVLWDMRELWTYSSQAHQLLAKEVFEMSQEVFVVWAEMKQYFVPYFSSLWGKIRHFENSFVLWEALRDFLQNSQKKYFIVFKWSQNTIFLEEAVKAVLQNPDDAQHLCRQEAFWQEKKKKFFQGIL